MTRYLNHSWNYQIYSLKVFTLSCYSITGFKHLDVCGWGYEVHRLWRHSFQPHHITKQLGGLLWGNGGWSTQLSLHFYLNKLWTKTRRSREYNEVIYLLFSSHNEWSFPLGTGKRLLYFLWRGRAKYSVNFKALYTSLSTIFYAEAIMSLCFIIRHSHITFLCFSTKDTDNSNQKLHYSEVA